MAYANPSTFVAGEVLTAAQQNVLANNDRFLHGPPMVRVEGAATTGTTSLATHAIDFALEVKDTDTMWSSTAPTRIHIRTPGSYLTGGAVRWANSTAGSFRFMAVRLNGGTTNFVESLHQPSETGNIGPRQELTTLTRSLTSTQYLELIVQQDSGSVVNLTTDADQHSPSFWAVWMSS